MKDRNTISDSSQRIQRWLSMYPHHALALDWVLAQCTAITDEDVGVVADKIDGQCFEVVLRTTYGMILFVLARAQEAVDGGLVKP